MAKRLGAGLVLSAGVGVFASFGLASASTLEVDGGIIQSWQLPADVHTTPVTTTATEDDLVIPNPESPAPADDAAAEPTADAPEPTTDVPEPIADAPEPTADAPEPTADAPEPTADAPELTAEVPEPTAPTEPPADEAAVTAEP